MRGADGTNRTKWEKFPNSSQGPNGTKGQISSGICPLSGVPVGPCLLLRRKRSAALAWEDGVGFASLSATVPPPRALGSSWRPAYAGGEGAILRYRQKRNRGSHLQGCAPRGCAGAHNVRFRNGEHERAPRPSQHQRMHAARESPGRVLIQRAVDGGVNDQRWAARASSATMQRSR